MKKTDFDQAHTWPVSGFKLWKPALYNLCWPRMAKQSVESSPNLSV